MKSRKRIKSDETLITILETIKHNEGVTLSEVSEETGKSKSTVHGHLGTMEDYGFVFERDGKFWLGLRFYEYGVLARESRLFYEMSRDTVDELAAETGERASSLIEEHGTVVHLRLSEGSQSVETDVREGRHSPLHCTAGGKVHLAFVSESRREELLGATEFERMTEKTITDASVLRGQLDEIRERGVAFNLGESIEGYHAIAAPVRSTNRGVYGAISIGGPANRLTRSWMTEELEDLILGAANEVEINMRHQLKRNSLDKIE